MTTTETKLPYDDPFAATRRGERREAYAGLAEQAPVHRVTLPDGEPAWLVTQYEAVRQALADPRLVNQRPQGSLTYSGLPHDLDGAMRSDMVHLDPPEHTRLRKLVSAAFTQRRVSGLAPRIQQVADELLDKMAQSETVDLIDAFTFPLPMTMIGHLLGVPPGNMSAVRSWSRTFMAGSLAYPDACAAAATNLLGYIRALRSKMGRAELAKAMSETWAAGSAETLCGRAHGFTRYLPREPRDGAAEGAPVGSGGRGTCGSGGWCQ
jgi:cytochrome P450